MKSFSKPPLADI